METGLAGARHDADGGTGRTVRVLHVDDEPEFGELTTAYLERENPSFEVVTETSARDGLTRLEDGDVDCIVSDYDMAEMNGIEFLERVRERDGTLPFILFTGMGSEAVASNAITAGVTDYLQKERGSEQFTLLANRIVNSVDHARAEREVRRGFDAMNAAREGIGLLDENGEFTFVNRAYADLFGYDRDELVGQHWEVLYPEADVQTVREDLLPSVPETGRWEGETENVTKNGERLVVDHALAYASDGTLLCLANDITARRTDHADDATAVSRDLLARAIDEAPVGVTISGSAADDVPLVYANDGFERLTGYPPAESLGRNCSFLQGEDTDEDRVRELAAAIQRGVPASVELRNYRRDGTEFWNRVTVAPLPDEDGDPANFVGFQEDVTERKRKERQLERQLGQFDAFGSVLSHDTRTPLQVVSGRIELAAETGDLDHLEKATAGLDRLETLLDDLAAVMREGELVTDVTAVALDDVATDIWRSIETGEATLDADETTVCADRNALARLLENLFKNCVDHAGPGAHVTVGGLPNGFYVADDGPGISADQRDSVFEFGTSTKESGAETGRGLASVEQIAVSHGWDVRVTESETGGARFEFTDVDTENEDRARR